MPFLEVLKVHGLDDGVSHIELRGYIWSLFALSVGQTTNLRLYLHWAAPTARKLASLLKSL